MKYKILLPTIASIFLTTLLLHQPIHAQADNASPAKTLTGRFITEEVYAPALKDALLEPSTNRMVTVYLPQHYDTRPDSAFPVIYALHYGMAKHGHAIEMFGGKLGLDAFFSSPDTKQMIVVFPDVSFTNTSGYDMANPLTNSSVSGNWKDFITDDLISYIDSTYRTIPKAASRGVTGLGDTGCGAIKLGMLRPDLFKAVYALAPLELAFENTFLGGIWSSDLRRMAANPENYINSLPHWRFEVMFSECIAYAPDPTATPLPCHLPYDSQGALIDSVWQQWLEHDPYTMLTNPEYRQNLIDLNGLAFDLGTPSTYYTSPTRVFEQALTDAGIPHEYKEYEGAFDAGLQARVKYDVLPFFAEKLAVASAIETDPGIPDAYSLSQNYPNPFNPTTTISYSLSHPAAVTLTVYDLLGRQLRVLASGMKPAGHYEVIFDATGLSSSLYVYHLQAGNYVETRPMMLLK